MAWRDAQAASKPAHTENACQCVWVVFPTVEERRFDLHVPAFMAGLDRCVSPPLLARPQLLLVGG